MTVLDHAPQTGRLSMVVKILAWIPTLVFVAFVCYALAVSNTTEVHDACGKQLWEMMLAHLLVPLGLVLVIVVGTVIVVLCTFGFSDVGESHLPIAATVVTVLVMLMYCSLFLGLGYPIVRDAMYSEACVNALSHVSFTHTPLLGILGCVYMVMDVIVLALILFALLFGGSFLFCIKKLDKEEKELHEVMPFNAKEPERDDLILWPLPPPSSSYAHSTEAHWHHVEHPHEHFARERAV
jgi:hypothetical protein